MMKYTPPRGAIPERLHLSEAQKQVLMDEADRVVAETLQANELFIANGRELTADHWKHVKSREKVHVYRSRRAAAAKPRRSRGSHAQSLDEKDPSRPRLLSNSTIEQQHRDAVAAGRPHAFGDDYDTQEVSHTHSSSSDCGSFTMFENSVLDKMKPPNVPLIIGTGVVDGCVEDVAFGALANTKYAWIVRNSYVNNDEFDDRRLLTTLQAPSEEDPFRFVGVKWATRDYGAFITRRDFLFIESTGIALDSDGERVFYNLSHSIELPECPPLPPRFNLIRVKLSSCHIARQLNDDSVEVYARGFVDPGGDLLENHGVALMAQAVASVAGIVECSNLKKLAWFMARRRRSDAQRSQYSSDCGVCGKQINKLANLIQPPIGCPICRHVTCSKCSVQKKLTVDVTEEVIQKQVTFCLSCVIQARKLSAWDVATASLQTP
ncbi:hypothetical protein BBJ28_00021078 [Nothophytophthora sp. Chile5]|nr:hypothetical protein BBJ28_00021078 [Nothophytophthora sp. Chile5]